jgi:hypothetical protein
MKFNPMSEDELARASLLEAGTLSELDCEGKSGFVKLRVEPANSGYPAKNSVADYVKPAASSTAPMEFPRQLTPSESDKKHGLDEKAKFDDDIPFN